MPQDIPDEDARFVAALRRRDERAFNRLVLRYQDRVYNVIYRLLGSPEEARDVTQEVFVTVFEKIHLYRGDGRLATWIFRIAANHARNRIKYLARRYDRRTEGWDDLLAEPEEGSRLSADIPRPDQVLERRRLEAFIGRALLLLDEDQRLAVVLRDIEGLSYEEIGAVTAASAGTVKSRLHRGRARLLEALAAYQRGDDPTAPVPVDDAREEAPAGLAAALDLGRRLLGRGVA